MTGFSGHRSRIGMALVALGLLVNPWTIGYLVAEDGRIDDTKQMAAVLFFSVACLLAGLQLVLRWVEPLSWGRPVGGKQAAAAVALAAAVVAGTTWRIASYNNAHRHTHVVEVAQQHATPEQEQWAEDFYQRSLAAALKHGWFDFDAAMAQGFQPDRVSHNHFPNPTYMFDDVILDPERPEWLVYDNAPTGKVLMALMFFTRNLEDVGPTPGGPIAQWHYHPFDRPRCAIEGIWSVGRPDENGVCAEGIPVMRSPEMFHVWFIDHPLGRFTEMKIVPEYGRDGGFDFRKVHPVAVHFAIGLFVVAVLLDLAAVVTRKSRYHWAAWINLVLAVVAIATAVFTGMTAEVLSTPTHLVHQVLDAHKRFAFASLGIVLLLFSWRFVLRGEFPRKAAILYIALSIVGLGTIGAAGYHGGELVYTHGAGSQAVDRFARDRYWKQVREYQGLPATAGEHTGH
jgi:uncharacterized membrane protein